MSDDRILVVRAGDPSANLEPLAATLANAGWAVEWARETDPGPMGLKLMVPILDETPTFTGAGDTRGPEGEPWGPR